MTSSAGSGDDDDDGDDDVAFTGDDLMSSVAVDEFTLFGRVVPAPTDAGMEVVHLVATDCSASGEGVDVAW